MIWTLSLLTAIALVTMLDTHCVAMAARLTDSLDTTSDDSAAIDRRGDHLRIFGGGASLIGFGAPTEYFPLLNLGYRWVWGKSSRPMSVVPAGEIGVNVLFPSFLLPYLKVGPELRAGRLRVAGHAGFMMMVNPPALYSGISLAAPLSDDRSVAMAAIPFAGLSANYEVLMQGVEIDLEGGASFPNLSRFGALAYLSTGVAFR